MTNNQKWVLAVLIFVIFAMLIYPPFHVIGKDGVVINMGYGWLFDPPRRSFIDANVNVSMLLIQWVGALIIGGLAFFLVKDLPRKFQSRRLSETGPTPSQTSAAPHTLDPETPSAAKSDNVQGPIGVGGWLLLLIVGMTILGPLLGAARINAEIWMAEEKFPTLLSVDEWITYKTANWWTFFVFAAISFWGGLGLAQRKDWSVVTRAKVVLWISGPVAVLILNAALPAIIFGELDADGESIIGALVGTVIAAATWTAYLSQSVRVKNTYSGKVNRDSSDQVAGIDGEPHQIGITKSSSSFDSRAHLIIFIIGSCIIAFIVFTLNNSPEIPSHTSTNTKAYGGKSAEGTKKPSNSQQSVLPNDFDVNRARSGFQSQTYSENEEFQSFSPHQQSYAVEETETADVNKIARIQEILTRLGYGPVYVDGKVGPRTTEAIMAFERSRGWSPQTGRPSEKLLRALEARLRTVARLSEDETNYEEKRCEYKTVMTDEDYRACGITPPSSY
jgi:hypothetical protein